MLNIEYAQGMSLSIPNEARTKYREARTMQKIILEVEVDDKTATAYRNASPEKQEQVKQRARQTLQRVLMTPEEVGAEFDRITAKAGAFAKEQGWTDEMNEALLRGEHDE